MILVLAIGNPIRGDDGAAAAAVRGLEGSRPGLEVLSVHGLLPEHAEPLAAAAGAVFVDARAGAPAGAVSVEAVGPSLAGLPDPHALGPAQVLALAEDLFGTAPAAAAVTVGAGSLEIGEGLSPAVEAALPAVREAVLAVMDGWEREGGGDA